MGSDSGGKAVQVSGRNRCPKVFVLWVLPHEMWIIDRVSMYSHLLCSALDTPRPSDDAPTAGDALSELVRCRTRLSAGVSFRNRPEWALPAVADQLAYDVALVGFSQRLGVAVDVLGFDRPGRERARLERALVARGISLDEFQGSPLHNRDV